MPRSQRNDVGARLSKPQRATVLYPSRPRTALATWPADVVSVLGHDRQSLQSRMQSFCVKITSVLHCRGWLLLCRNIQSLDAGLSLALMLSIARNTLALFITIPVGL